MDFSYHYFCSPVGPQGMPTPYGLIPARPEDLLAFISGICGVAMRNFLYLGVVAWLGWRMHKRGEEGRVRLTGTCGMTRVGRQQQRRKRNDAGILEDLTKFPLPFGRGVGGEGRWRFCPGPLSVILAGLGGDRGVGRVDGGGLSAGDERGRPFGRRFVLTQNKMVSSPDGLYQFWFTDKASDYWPVTNTTFWIEWRLWGNRRRVIT